MKIFKKALLSTFTVLGATAKREIGSLPHTDHKGTTRAVCTFNTAKGARIEGQISGWTELEQPLTQSGLGKTRVATYWGYLDANESYTLKLKNDDGVECAGSSVETLGTFKPNNRNRGKMITEWDSFDIGGIDSMIGAYLQLEDQTGREVACCEIIERQTFWMDGGTAVHQ